MRNKLIKKAPFLLLVLLTLVFGSTALQAQPCNYAVPDAGGSIDVTSWAFNTTPGYVQGFALTDMTGYQAGSLVSFTGVTPGTYTVYAINHNAAELPFVCTGCPGANAGATITALTDLTIADLQFLSDNAPQNPAPNNTGPFCVNIASRSIEVCSDSDISGAQVCDGTDVVMLQASIGTYNSSAGYVQTYVAFDGTGNFIAESATAVFTGLAQGTYDVYAVNYDSADYVGGITGLTLASLQADTVDPSLCMDVSAASIAVEVIDCTVVSVTDVCLCDTDTDNDVIVQVSTPGSFNNTADHTQTYIITDASGMILAVDANGTFDPVALSLADGSYNLYALNYANADAAAIMALYATGLNIDGLTTNTDAMGNSTGAECYQILGPVVATVNIVTGCDCGPIVYVPDVCLCDTDLMNDVIIITSAPGSFNNTVDHTQTYILTDATGEILAVDPTGTFDPAALALADGAYTVHALNYANADAAAIMALYATGLNISGLNTSIDAMGNSTGALCYQILSTPASVNTVAGCDCGPIVYIPDVCLCDTDLMNDVIIITSAPGSFNNTVDHTQTYILTDATGEILAVDPTGTFDPAALALADGAYTVHALNYANADAAAIMALYATGLNISGLNTSIDAMGNSTGALCYQILSTPASVNTLAGCDCVGPCTANSGDIPQIEFCEGQDPATVESLPYVGDFWDGVDTDGIFDPQFNGPYGPPPSPLADYSYTYVLTNDDPGGTTGSTILEGPDATAAFGFTALAPGVYRVYAIVWRSAGGVTVQNSGGGALAVGDDVEAAMVSDGSGCIDITFAYVTVLPAPAIAASSYTCATDGTGGEVTLTGLAAFTFYTVTGLGAADGTYPADPSGNVVVPGVVSGSYSITVTDQANGCPSNAVTVDVACDGQIGDLVWDDADSDGTNNGGTESGISGVTVNLTWYGPDGVLGGGDDVVYTTMTDLNGNYLFTGLPLGEYQVDVVGAPGTQTGDPDGTLDDSSVVTLGVGTEINLDQDFGYQSCTVAITLDPIPDNEVCSGELIRLDVLVEDAGVAQAGVAYTWVAMDGATMVANGADMTSGAGTASIQDSQFNATAAAITITYTVTSGCGSATQDFIVYPNPTVDLVTSDFNGFGIDCNGESTGSITAMMVNGTGPYDYLWSNGATTATITGVPAGNYSVTVSDMGNGGCPAIANVSLNQASALSCDNLNVMNETCAGDADGSAEILPTGGVAPYTFAWSNGGTTAAITGLAAGTYDLTVTDANGCECTTSATVNAGGSAGDPLFGFDVETFEGDNGGINTYYYNTVVMTVWGGTPPYIFEWDKTGYVRTTVVYELVDTDGDGVPDTPGATLTVIYSDASEWTVTVSDDNACGDPTEILEFSNNDLNMGNMNDILDIDSYTTTSDTGGGNGSFELNITGGGPACGSYTYEVYFQDGTLVDSGAVSGSVLNQNDLVSGWYTTYIYCTGTDETTIGWYWIEPERRGRGKIGGASMQMYPNPFSDVTNIEFNIAQPGNVTIDVFSIDGKLVRNLYNDVVQENVDYKVPFDGRNLPNGMYMVKLLTSNGDVYTEKLILNKNEPKPEPSPSPEPAPAPSPEPRP